MSMDVCERLTGDCTGTDLSEAGHIKFLHFKIKKNYKKYSKKKSCIAVMT